MVMLLILSPRLSVRRGQPSRPGSMHRIHASTPLSDLLCGRNGESFVNGSPSQAEGKQLPNALPAASPPTTATAIARGQSDCLG